MHNAGGICQPHLRRFSTDHTEGNQDHISKTTARTGLGPRCTQHAVRSFSPEKRNAVLFLLLLPAAAAPPRSFRPVSAPLSHVRAVRAPSPQKNDGLLRLLSKSKATGVISRI